MPRPKLEASLADRPPLAGKSVLVTGGAGFIGSHLVDRLIDESPSRLTVVDNLFLGREKNLDEARARFSGVQFYNQDATDAEAMARILDKQQVETSCTTSPSYRCRLRSSVRAGAPSITSSS